MERNVQRINGEVVKLHRLTDDELEGYMGAAHNRIESSVQDLEKLGIESARRYAESEVAVEGLAKVIQFPGQGVLFEMPDNIA
jgi:coproporphyrinogen III oxidase-like Fe-S oxidoreductase